MSHEKRAKERSRWCTQELVEQIVFLKSFTSIICYLNVNLLLINNFKISQFSNLVNCCYFFLPSFSFSFFLRIIRYPSTLRKSRPRVTWLHPHTNSFRPTPSCAISYSPLQVLHYVASLVKSSHSSHAHCFDVLHNSSSVLLTFEPSVLTLLLRI